MFKLKITKMTIVATLLLVTSSTIVHAAVVSRAANTGNEILNQSESQIIQTDQAVTSPNKKLIIKAVTQVTKVEEAEGIAILTENAPTTKPIEIKAEKSQVPKPAETEGKPEVKPEEHVEALTETNLDAVRFWTKQALNMRSGAGTNYGLMFTIPASTEVEGAAKVSNGWFKVVYNGQTGYVSGKYLSDKVVETPKPEVKPAAKPAAKPVQASLSNMTIYFPNKTVPFKNGGQSQGQAIIDNNSNIASTWGGAATFSGSDGLNTHFIAHNPGAFAGIWNYSMGEKITIVDHAGNITVYAVTDRFLADDNGIRQDNGENAYNYIASTRGGEVVTFQTCKTSSINWIVRATKVG